MQQRSTHIQWLGGEMFNDVKEQLINIGLPPSDLDTLPSSALKFDDGADFRIEIPTINSLEALDALLNESERLNIKINRVTETFGIFRHHQQNIRQMKSLCDNYGCQFIMSTGPRATYDTSATSQTAQGRSIGYRLRGQDQVIKAVEDIRRAIDLGIKSFLIYDEGLLWVVNEFKKSGFIPSYITFKMSAHCGHGNPASFKLLESLGANSINPVRDLQLPMIAALRQAISIPIDCHTDNPPSSGGFIRVYEAPEIVRIASPVYLKTGNSVITQHGTPTTANDGIKMAQQASIVLEIMQRYYPEAIQSQTGK